MLVLHFGGGFPSDIILKPTMGDATVLLHCSLLRNPRLKPAGVLEHCRE